MYYGVVLEVKKEIPIELTVLLRRAPGLTGGPMRALQIRASVLIAVVALSQPLVAADVVIEWNQRANASVLEAKTYPFAGTRVMAIVHTAMFDAINSIEGQYTPYLHDTLLQSFQGVIRHLHALTFILDRPAEVSEKLEGLLEMGSRAIIEGRDAVQGMRSSTVVNNDLAGAFAKVGERLAAEQNAQNPVNFRGGEVPKFAPDPEG
jgi:hypothetical protein